MAAELAKELGKPCSRKKVDERPTLLVVGSEPAEADAADGKNYREQVKDAKNTEEDNKDRNRDRKREGLVIRAHSTATLEVVYAQRLSSPAGDRRRSRLANVRWSKGLGPGIGELIAIDRTCQHVAGKNPTLTVRRCGSKEP